MPLYQVTNARGKGPRGVRTSGGSTAVIERGETRELDLPEEEAKSLPHLGLLDVVAVGLHSEAASLVEKASPATEPHSVEELDTLSDNELRALVEDREGRKPHPATSREKLIAKLEDEAEER